MIKIKKVEKKYGDTYIFKNFNLEIKKGNIITIIGPSGSGKTTFLNMLSGLDINYKGDIIIDNIKLNSLKSETENTKFRGQNIGFIFQNFHLIDNLTVEENIDLVIDINNLKRNFSTKEILKLVGLENKIKEYPYNLSGGERQRVAIARAFVGKNNILLADEPTGNLDGKNTKNIMKIIKILNKKIKNTIILITHDMEVAKVGNKIYEIKNYQLIEKNV